MTDSIEIIPFEPEDRIFRKKFLHLPFELYESDPNWVPPLMMDLRNIFNREKHGFYEHGEAQFLLAVKAGKSVGRLVMLHNRGPISGKVHETANFFLFEVENDYAVAEKILDWGVKWAEDRNIKKIFGPKGMTPMDGLGLLVRGFEHRPAFGMPYNPPYYPEYLQNYGFEIERITESGFMNAVDFKLPEKVLKAAKLVEKRKGFQVLRLKTFKDLKKAVSQLGNMYNEALTGTEGNVPLSEGDLETISQGLIWLAKPELIKLIMKDDKTIGFLLAYPDVSAALQATKGRLFPFGWARLLWEKHHTEMININGIGIVDEYRGSAATALLFSELYTSVTASGQFKCAEVIQIGVKNKRMRLELREMGINFYKSHALFELTL